jgi:hypothetical protein
MALLSTPNQAFRGLPFQPAQLLLCLLLLVLVLVSICWLGMIFDHADMPDVTGNTKPDDAVTDLSEVCQAWWGHTAEKWASESWTKGRGSGAAGHPREAAPKITNHVQAAICVSGQIRTFLEVIDSMEQNLFSLFGDDFHIFAVVSDLKDVAVVRKRLKRNLKLVVARDVPDTQVSEVLRNSKQSIVDTIGFVYAVPGGEKRRTDSASPQLQNWLKMLEGQSLCNELRHFYEIQQGASAQDFLLLIHSIAKYCIVTREHPNRNP